MRKPLVAGNWKMNGSSESIKTLLDGIKAGMGEVSNADVAVCAPAIYLPQVQGELNGSDVGWGSQDVSVHESGAYTGEIATSMLNDFGCKYAIVGHSERRADHGESDAEVRAKAEAAWRAGLTAIVCVGESEEERRGGIAEEVVGRQLAGSLPEGATGANLVVAYEPIWAIGTGLTPTVEDVAVMHAFMRSELVRRFGDEGRAMRLLYGGSVKPSNAGELLGVPDVDGALVGGASLKAVDFLGILAALD